MWKKLSMSICGAIARCNAFFIPDSMQKLNRLRQRVKTYRNEACATMLRV
jgi:hypothetical protein